MQLIAAQLATCIVPTLAYRLNSVERVDDETIDCELVLYSIHRFFALVNSLLRQSTRDSNGNKLHDRVVLALRQLISVIVQNVLVHSLPRYLNRLSEQLEQNNGNIRNILRIKTNLGELFVALQKFESTLRNANAYFKHYNDICLTGPSIYDKINTQELSEIRVRLSLINAEHDDNSATNTTKTETQLQRRRNFVFTLINR